MIEEYLVSPIVIKGDDNDISIRPSNIGDFIGQEHFIKNLNIYIKAAKNRNEPLDHILLSGPPGLGKTTLANIIANEMGGSFKSTSAPIIEKSGDIAALLTDLSAGDVLFIDEIHRLKRNIEELLYSAMEDFQIDIMVGQGPSAKSIKLSIEPFTLIGATTRAGMISGPLRARFGISENLEYYTQAEIKKIIKRSASILGVGIDNDGASIISGSSRGTPRVANRLLRRVRDFAEVISSSNIDKKIAEDSLKRLSVDSLGLTRMDIRFLEILINNFAGGPVGAKTMAIALSEEVETIEDVYEPYLIQIGMLKRTSRGRVATQNAYSHLKIETPADTNLFD